MIPLEGYYDQYHNLIISPSRQSNYLWCRHFYFTLFNCNIWLRKLYHRAAPPPIRTTLGRGPRTLLQPPAKKGCLHPWFNSDHMASSRVWPFLRKGFPKRDSSFNYLVHTDHVLLSYWGFSCFSTIKKWHKNTSSKAPWIGTQVPEDRLRGWGETSVGHPPTSLGSQQGMKEQFSSQTPLYEDPAPHRSQPLRQVGAGGGKRGHFLGSVVWWRASQVGTEPWEGKGGAAPRAGPRLQAGRGDWRRL